MHKEKQYRRCPSVLAASSCVAASWANSHPASASHLVPARAACLWPWATHGASGSLTHCASRGFRESPGPVPRRQAGPGPDHPDRRLKMSRERPPAQLGTWHRAEPAWQAGRASPGLTGRSGPPCPGWWPGGSGSRLRRDRRERARPTRRPTRAWASFLGPGPPCQPQLEAGQPLALLLGRGSDKGNRPSAVRGPGALPLAPGEIKTSSALCPKLDGHNRALSSIGPRCGLTHSLLEGNTMKRQES